jgi:hypothetical protein
MAQGEEGLGWVFEIDGTSERNEDADDHDFFLDCHVGNNHILQFLRMSLPYIQPSPYPLPCWCANTIKIK